MTRLTPATTYSFDDKGVEADVHATSISGRPVASLTIDGHPVDELEISHEDTRLVVRGVVSATPELESTTAMLIVPVVQLEHQSGDAKALLILTTRPDTIGGPQLVKGALEKLKTRKLNGTASVVQS